MQAMGTRLQTAAFEAELSLYPPPVAGPTPPNANYLGSCGSNRLAYSDDAKRHHSPDTSPARRVGAGSCASHQPHGGSIAEIENVDILKVIAGSGQISAEYQSGTIGRPPWTEIPDLA
jgi:hypothetical protein